MRRKSPEDLTEEELRWLLVEKRRTARLERLERYRRTGRVITVLPDESARIAQPLRTSVEEIMLDEEELPAHANRRRKVLDGFLLFVEIVAVVGFLFVVFNGLSLIRELNREVAAALEQPTLTPTPLLMAVVLPSGHTPPNSPGGARPNEAEIPEHLRPLVQSFASLPLPTPSPQQAIRIQIPAIKVDAPIVQGDGWEQLKKGVGQSLGTPNPGEKGNVVLSAHNDIFGEIFRDLDKLQKGDEVILYTSQRAFTYEVVSTKIVEPTAVEVMAQTAEPIVTLISCYPYMVDNQRIVVVARLKDRQ
ncbi:MAG: class D sortase [Anaerolineales bacterium]|nr:class D sortase [Anaerolineales bacterium]MCS7248236.1 class D sortase [Anaerolineales bacterium]MDW8162049.1 class D sortase [Anaerolineales bacterium]MDW8448137.1 class D sortase [Anaerolineales bacterium]